MKAVVRSREATVSHRRWGMRLRSIGSPPLVVDQVCVSDTDLRPRGDPGLGYPAIVDEGPACAQVFECEVRPLSLKDGMLRGNVRIRKDDVGLQAVAAQDSVRPMQLYELVENELGPLQLAAGDFQPGTREQHRDQCDQGSHRHPEQHQSAGLPDPGLAQPASGDFKQGTTDPSAGEASEYTFPDLAPPGDPFGRTDQQAEHTPAQDARRCAAATDLKGELCQRQADGAGDEPERPAEEAGSQSMDRGSRQQPLGDADHQPDAQADERTDDEIAQVDQTRERKAKNIAELPADQP